ncbi:hypothetical protein CAEBREN_30203 [Caenorhabditis brenneri]|uniref:Uncharacterized protein n=1 Tax=Caenorhabditis brenneri TaxID=135651 RepID=G0NMT6_CAEBE|nr:hypothetical protein CAEBREN_30203 [Caenorhabditis brenneri]
MYINWAHHYIPKLSGTCSVLINSLFIYIVHDDKKIKLGDYPFLLIFFALYNFTSTAVDLLVPTCVLDYNYGFSMFVSDGVFEKEALPEVIRNSWIAISIATMISVYSVTVCLIFGTLIIVKLQKEDLSMSEKTKRLQKQLMKALIVQSSIPIIVCFCPCFAAWYLPVFELDIGNWIYWISAVAISFFPVLDPLALFYFIPAFRLRVKEIFRIKVPTNNVTFSSRVITMST